MNGRAEFTPSQNAIPEPGRGASQYTVVPILLESEDAPLVVVFPALADVGRAVVDRGVLLHR